MNRADLVEASHEVLRLLRHYKGGASQGELGADRVLYGYLQGRFGYISRQHQVTHGRIDFRYGGTNPMVLEFVLRGPSDPRTRLFASQNRSELRKLTRVRPTTAATRVLLLLDRSKNPVPKRVLRTGYDEMHAGRGRFVRHSIRIIYVNRFNDYHFLWRPEVQGPRSTSP